MATGSLAVSVEPCGSGAPTRSVWFHWAGVGGLLSLPGRGQFLFAVVDKSLRSQSRVSSSLCPHHPAHLLTPSLFSFLT